MPRPLAPTSSAALVPYGVFFDGGTCNRNGNSATGAGALLWYIHSSGPPTCIARAVFAAPGNNSEIGWNIEWQVVNRRHNTHAHALARIAAVWANNLCRDGRRVHRSVFEWRGLQHTSCNHFMLTAWP